MKLFLDLEETVINSWNDHRLCNLSGLRRFFKANAVTEVTVFSFAIYDERDKEYFEKHLKSLVEDALAVKVVAWPSVDDLLKTILWKYGTSFDRVELINVWGKTRAFFDFCRATQEEDCVLIDDVVQHESWVWHDRNLKFTTLNVESL